MGEIPAIYNAARKVVRHNQPFADLAKKSENLFDDELAPFPIMELAGVAVRDLVGANWAKIKFARSLRETRGDVSISGIAVPSPQEIGQEGFAGRMAFDDGTQIPSLAYAHTLVRIQDQWYEQNGLTSPYDQAPEGPPLIGQE